MVRGPEEKREMNRYPSARTFWGGYSIRKTNGLLIRREKGGAQTCLAADSGDREENVVIGPPQKEFRKGGFTYH